MRVYFAQFLKSEDGAVTVDWVVLTAAVVGLAIGVVAAISDAALDESDGLAAFVDDQTIPTYDD